MAANARLEYQQYANMVLRQMQNDRQANGGKCDPTATRIRRAARLPGKTAWLQQRQPGGNASLNGKWANGSND